MKTKLMTTILTLVMFFVFVNPVLWGNPDSAKDYKVIKKAASKDVEISWFKLQVTDDKGKTKVKITLPISMIDWIAECCDDEIKLNDKCRFDFKKLIKELKRHGPLAIVEAYDDDEKETVKIWFE